ncbi:hypothetical protein OVA26_13915 [Microbacterium sp. SL62]|nr:hypothetical protein [Microbacterium sp. SL62]MCY1718034.1 hypothetical protein [Microbacterium sp. SL62]
MQVRPDDGGPVTPRERGASREREVQHPADLVQVASRADGLPAQLLGRGELGVSDHSRGDRRHGTAQNVVAVGRLSRRIGEAEIEERRSGKAVVDDVHEHVRWRHIAVHETDRVSGTQRIEDVPGHRRGVDRGERTGGTDVLSEGHAFDDLLGNPCDGDAVLAEGPHVDDGDDRRVGDVRRPPALAEEGLADGVALREVGMQQFDGDGLTGHLIPGAEDGCRSPGAEEPFDAEPPRDETAGIVYHQSAPSDRPTGCRNPARRRAITRAAPTRATDVRRRCRC